MDWVISHEVWKELPIEIGQEKIYEINLSSKMDKGNDVEIVIGDLMNSIWPGVRKKNPTLLW